MKRINSFVTGLVLVSSALISNNALASSEMLTNVSIEEIRTRAGSSNPVIRFSSAFVNACNDGGGWAQLVLDGSEGTKAVMSTLLLAYAQGKNVSVATTGECSWHNNIGEIQLLK